MRDDILIKELIDRADPAGRASAGQAIISIHQIIIFKLAALILLGFTGAATDWYSPVSQYQAAARSPLWLYKLFLSWWLVDISNPFHQFIPEWAGALHEIHVNTCCDYQLKFFHEGIPRPGGERCCAGGTLIIISLILPNKLIERDMQAGQCEGELYKQLIKEGGHKH